MMQLRPIRLLGAAALAGLSACRSDAEPVTEPRQVSPSPFEYPEELWDAGVQGRTTLRLFISEAGTVDSVRVEQPSGQEAFDSAALAGARRLRFQPARRGERPVAVWRSLPVEFTLGQAARGAVPDSQTRRAQ